jgi:isoleucyl-tRNA synthetase
MDYKATLNLPKTAFPMKADLPAHEPEMLARWEAEDLYGQSRRSPHPQGFFILHDGPPYANGDIHIGHALNKILKDITIRFHTLRGFDCPYIPGWDCHGMPIEHQLFKELGLTKAQISQASFREQARAYAQRYVDIQREQFKRLGVLGDWSHPYLTMSKEYELAILRTFLELVKNGYIYRGKKPVYWCASCETALAEAEVEYEDRQDDSIYVAFPLAKPLGGVIETQGAWDDTSVVVWTTTPWTLPANVALCFHPTCDYSQVLARHANGKEARFIIASSLAQTVLSKLRMEFVQELRRFPGSTFGKLLFAGQYALQCQHPYGRASSIGLTDEGVSLEEGSGIVHIAPGHGQEDYQIAQRAHLEVFSPVDARGCYTKDVKRWAGVPVWEANPRIIDDLRARALLLGQEAITHSYPHCWRCQQPVIFRSTPQWFLSVERQDLRGRLRDAASQVRWIPPTGQSRISGMLEHRPDWCLSRQRYWGSPIPILHCLSCDKPLMQVSVIDKVIDALTAHGVESWFSASVQELLPGLTCPECGGRQLQKDPDILDVWFDSGVSHEAVLKDRQAEGMRWPAQLYLEGSDQHRGWFQVSLITAVALHKQPPYEQVVTHGFVMDGEGRKMSKSLGNVIAPQDVMHRYGADILRLWVASSDYREDVRISDEILGQVAESYRKFRNTFRYLLANLYDFNPTRDRVHARQCQDIDKWALHCTGELLETVNRAYSAYQFHEAVRAIYQFCVLDLSAFYLDALKDRLYTEAAAAPTRRCAQTVLYDILQALVRMLAPILVVTTDEVWRSMSAAGWVSGGSVHLAAWPQPFDVHLDEASRQRWATFLSMRSAVMRALEDQRNQGVIGSPLEAQVTLVVNDQRLGQLVGGHCQTLAEVCVVSRVVVEMDGMASAPAMVEVPGLVAIHVSRAPGQKCARCWKYLSSVGGNAAHPQLCERCVAVVKSIEMK